jgi:putative ABC transport system permease protein
MIPLLRKANRRHFRRHPWQLLLTMAGVALGVAMMTSIDLAIESARKAFTLSMDALTGKTTHHIVGASAGLDEKLYAALRRDGHLDNIAPVVEAYVTVGDETLRLLGIDPFAEQGVRSRFAGSFSPALVKLLTETDGVLLSRVSARRLGIQAGSELILDAAGRQRAVQVLDLIEPPGQADPALEGLLLTDIATAQEILDRTGVLDRIDVTLSDDPGSGEALRRRLPPDTELVSAAGRNSAEAKMTHAFEVNLRAMSLLALLVGMFLIYHTMTFAVVQRRQLIATLRILGATRFQILHEILLEAIYLGAAGALAGLALALLAAKGLLDLVTRTINDVYFVLTVSQLLVSTPALVKGLAIGVAAAFLAALPPALEAAWSKPAAARQRSSIETRAHRLLPWLAAAGLALGAIAGGLLSLPSTSLVLAIFALFLLMVGFSLAMPLVVTVLVRLVDRLLSPFRTPLSRLAIRGVSGSLSRTGVAIAALTLAVSASVGVGLMITSFRETIDEWLRQLLQADVYVALPEGAGRAGDSLPADVLSRIAMLNGVERVSSGRQRTVATSLGQAELMVLDPAYPERPSFRFKYTEGAEIWQRFLQEPMVLVSEPYAYRHGLAPGKEITLTTDSGPRHVPVGGIFYDYRSDQGLIVMHRRLYESYWNDRAITSAGLYLADDADIDAVRADLKRLLGGDRRLVIRSNREIREASLELFDRTFAITQIMRLLAIGVAFIGLFSALMALQFERTRELAILRASGLTPGETGYIVLVQTGFMGLCAGMLAVPLGLLVALALVRVINLRSFGWSMELFVSRPLLLEAVGLALLAALLGGLYPAWRAARVSPSVALREE